MTRLIPHALFMLLVSGAAASAETAEMLRVEGRAARLTGKFDTAIDKLREATQAEPGNADIHVELGLALTGGKRYGEAGAEFRRAMEISPDYSEARLGLIRLEYFQGRFAEARKLAAQMAAEEPESGADVLVAQIDKAIAAGKKDASRKAAAGAEGKRKAMTSTTRINLGPYDVTPASAPPPTRWRLDLDGSRSKLSGDRPTWIEASGRAGYEVRPGTTVSGGFQAARRYDQDDTYLDVRLDHKLSDATSFYIQTGATPDPDFLAEWSASGGAAIRLLKQPGFFAATVLTMDARHSDYTTGEIQTYSLGLEQYFMDGRIWLTARWIHMVDADGGQHDGYLARADVIVNDQVRLFAGYSDAPETDQGLTFDTRSLFGGAVIALDERTDLKISFAHEERVDLFDLNSISTGITYRY
jgi:YaiO family outer membrane protein